LEGQHFGEGDTAKGAEVGGVAAAPDARLGPGEGGERGARSADPMHAGGNLEVKAKVNLGGLSPDDVQVQLFHGLVGSLGEIPQPHTAAMSTNGAPREGNTWQFSGTIPCRSSGRRGFAVRVLPRHGDLGNPHEPGLVTWG
jgi:starch phosphorylase